MNIAIDIRALMHSELTGVAVYSSELLSALFSLDRDNRYFVFYNSFSDVSRMVPKWTYDNVHLLSTSVPSKVFHLGLLSGVFKLDVLVERLAKKRGILPQHETIDAFFSPNLHFTSLRQTTRKVQMIHDVSFVHLPECYTYAQRLWHRLQCPKATVRRADHVTVPSYSTKYDVMRMYGISSDMVSVVYPGIPYHEEDVDTIVDVQYVREKYHLSQPFIFSLGALEPRKYFMSAINAFVASSLPGQGYEYIIAGAAGWDNHSLRALMKKTPAVRFLGYVSASEKIALYKQAAAFIYPSLYEGFGLPVLEAMTMGTPVITSNRSSLPEVVGSAGELVNVLNERELTRSMERITLNSTLQHIYRERGGKQAQTFSWLRSARVLQTILTGQ